MTMTENLWPELDLEIETISIKKILLEQAEFLMKSTKNILEASVITSTFNSAIDHYFNIIAPLLDGYTFTLFWVRQKGLDMYPCSIFFQEKELIVEDETKFIEVLKDTFKHPSTLNVIKSLLAQSRDNKPLGNV
ncbi:MAG: hypothetical protein MUF58_21465 [Arcicella sp.]|jgi:hypothetical protein|nr:hypothetical protein [Arcicella sp.]